MEQGLRLHEEAERINLGPSCERDTEVCQQEVDSRLLAAQLEESGANHWAPGKTDSTGSDSGWRSDTVKRACTIKPFFFTYTGLEYIRPVMPFIFTE